MNYHKNEFFGTLRIEPGATGCEGRTLSIVQCDPLPGQFLLFGGNFCPNLKLSELLLTVNHYRYNLELIELVELKLKLISVRKLTETFWSYVQYQLGSFTL